MYCLECSSSSLVIVIILWLSPTGTDCKSFPLTFVNLNPGVTLNETSVTFDNKCKLYSGVPLLKSSLNVPLDGTILVTSRLLDFALYTFIVYVLGLLFFDVTVTVISLLPVTISWAPSPVILAPSLYVPFNVILSVPIGTFTVYVSSVLLNSGFNVKLLLFDVALNVNK